MNLKKTNARIASVKLCYQKQKLGNSQLGEAILMQKMKIYQLFFEKKYILLSHWWAFPILFLTTNPVSIV